MPEKPSALATVECRLCHRIGHKQFSEAGGEQWECSNDRACARRVVDRVRKAA